MEINSLLRKNIAQIQPYSSARDECKEWDRQMVFLDANENPYQNGINRYPDPQQKKLKQKIAELKGVEEKQILLGNGSDEVLDLVFRVFCEPNVDNVITLPPTYGMYSVLANLNAVKNKEVVLTTDFEPNIEAIINQVDENTKIIFLCSPNNPTGNSFPEESIEMLLNRFKGLVLLDEAYIDFSDKRSWIYRLCDYPNLIISQTFSKAYGMAGIRLGVLYASTEIISVLNQIKPPYNINILSQDKALQQLTKSKKVNVEIANIKRNREDLIKELLEVKFINKIFRTDANFLLVKVDDADKRYDQLLSKKIVVRNRSSQPLCDNCLRITIGTKKENNQLINALKTM